MLREPTSDTRLRTIYEQGCGSDSGGGSGKGRRVNRCQ